MKLAASLELSFVNQSLWRYQPQLEARKFREVFACLLAARLRDQVRIDDGVLYVGMPKPILHESEIVAGV